MKKYRNIIYLGLPRYKEIYKKFKEDNFFVIESDMENFQKKENLISFFQKKINAPKDYFFTLSGFGELFFQFPSYKNPKKICLIIKNYESLKKIDKYYYKYLLELLDTAVDYLNKSKEASFKVYVFLDKIQLKNIKKRKFDKTITSYITK